MINNLQTIKDSITVVLSIMSEREYARTTIKTQRHTLNVFVKFMESNNYSELNEEVGMAFIREKTGITMQGFWGAGNRKINHYMKPIQNLLYYQRHGNLYFFMRSHVAPFVCPPVFEAEYQAFQNEYRQRDYADATIISNNNTVHKFLYFLEERNISTSKAITPSCLTYFLLLYSKSKPKYVATVLYVLRNYLTFLYDTGFTKKKLSVSLPHVRILRNAFIPHSWNTEDVIKLLNAIDRSDSKGKRDYAIILMVVRLCFRVSDMRRMKLSDLNWNRKTITISMQKTKQTLELPLLDDIGWAVIDYLKNGRPKTKCNRVFIRHRAPFDAFGENESFYKELHRYMQAAGIVAPNEVHCGLHSLALLISTKPSCR